MDKKQGLQFDRAEYDQIFHDVEHGDRQEQHFTSQEFEEQEQLFHESSPRKKILLQHRFLPICVLMICLVSLGWYALYARSSNDLLSEEQAKSQLKKIYGEGYQTVGAITAFISSQGEPFQSEIDRLNAALADENASRPEFLKDYFYLFGETLVYTEPNEKLSEGSHESDSLD